jgi:hypothetical protein
MGNERAESESFLPESFTRRLRRTGGGTMNKLKLLVLAVLAAAVVGTGALAAAPSASAAGATTTKSGKSAANATRATSASLEERPKICFIFGPWKYCI